VPSSASRKPFASGSRRRVTRRRGDKQQRPPSPSEPASPETQRSGPCDSTSNGERARLDRVRGSAGDEHARGSSWSRGREGLSTTSAFFAFLRGLSGCSSSRPARQRPGADNTVLRAWVSQDVFGARARSPWAAGVSPALKARENTPQRASEPACVLRADRLHDSGGQVRDECALERARAPSILAAHEARAPLHPAAHRRRDGLPSHAGLSASLPEGAPACCRSGRHEKIPDFSPSGSSAPRFLPAFEELDHVDAAARARQGVLSDAGIEHDRALACWTLQELLLSELVPRTSRTALVKGFQVYKSAGWTEGRRRVFTAYCTRSCAGSLEPTTSPLPLYSAQGPREGRDGAVIAETPQGRRAQYPSASGDRGHQPAQGPGASCGSPIRNRRVPRARHGSAFIELADGSLYRLATPARNGRTYTSLGKELESDGKLPAGRPACGRSAPGPRRLERRARRVPQPQPVVVSSRPSTAHPTAASTSR